MVKAFIEFPSHRVVGVGPGEIEPQLASRLTLHRRRTTIRREAA